jgi:hypothetical protein
VSPLSFAYFSLRRQRKVGAAPHRGNANKPISNQGKANASRKQQRGNTNRPITKQGKANTQIKQQKGNANRLKSKTRPTP